MSGYQSWNAYYLIWFKAFFSVIVWFVSDKYWTSHFLCLPTSLNKFGRDFIDARLRTQSQEDNQQTRTKSDHLEKRKASGKSRILFYYMFYLHNLKCLENGMSLRTLPP